MQREFTTKYSLYRNGTGSLELMSRPVATVDWKLMQTAAGSLFIALSAHNDSLGALDLRFLLTTCSSSRIVGVDTHGHTVSATIGNQTNPVHEADLKKEWLTFRANDVEILSPETQAISYRYALANLRTKEPPVAEWIVEGTRISVAATDDYEVATSMLYTRDRFAITSFLTVETSNRARAEAYADIACDLLSFAAGCRVAWIHEEGRDVDGNIISTRALNAITAPYVPLPLIAEQRLWDFVAKHWLTYTEFRDGNPKQARRLLGLLLNSTATDDFLEVRGSKLASTIEAVTTIVLSHVNPAWFPSKSIERKFISAMREHVQREAHTHLPEDAPDNVGSREERVKHFKSKVDELLRPTFREQIENVHGRLHLPIDPDQIQKFVQSRNELVHEAQFKCQSEKNNADWPFPTPGAEYFSMLRFADRLILRTIGYRGPFLDRSLRNGDEIPADALPDPSSPSI